MATLVPARPTTPAQHGTNTEQAPLWAADLLARVPGADCGATPTGALQSLYPKTRRDWLASNALPRSVAYFTIISLPLPDQVAPLLRVPYRRLAKFDPHNDGQVTARDQVIPGSALLAFANADHWAIALPMSRFDGVDGSTFFGRDDFPIEILVEAILRYVETAAPGGEKAANQPGFRGAQDKILPPVSFATRSH